MQHVVLVSHGTDDADGAEAISGLVAAVAAELDSVAFSVHETYVDVQTPQLPEVLEGILAGESDAAISVVPLLLGNGYHVHHDIAGAILEASERHPAAKILLSPALGPHPLLATLLRQRLEESGWKPEDLVVLASAGSSDPESVRDSERVREMLAEQLSQLGARREPELAFLSAAEPRLKDLVPRLKFANPRARVLIANYLLAPGFFDNLAGRSGAHVLSAPLLMAKALAPEQLRQLVLERLAQAK